MSATGELHSQRGSGRLLPAVLALLMGALVVGTLTWLLSTGNCVAAEPGATGARSAPAADAPSTTGGPITPAPADKAVGCGRSDVVPGVVSAVGVLIVGLLVIVLASMSPGVSVPAKTRSEPVADPPANRGEATSAGVDARRTLVDALIYALDRLPGTAVEARLQEALSRVGVTPVGASGELFDPSRHEAVASVTATDVQQDGKVADVDAVGYLDGDVLIRPAQVSVYQSGR